MKLQKGRGSGAEESCDILAKYKNPCEHATVTSTCISFHLKYPAKLAQLFPLLKPIVVRLLTAADDVKSKHIILRKHDGRVRKAAETNRLTDEK